MKLMFCRTRQAFVRAVSLLSLALAAITATMEDTRPEVFNILSGVASLFAMFWKTCRAISLWLLLLLRACVRTFVRAVTWPRSEAERSEATS